MTSKIVQSAHLNEDTPAGTPVRYAFAFGRPRVGLYTGKFERVGVKLTSYIIEHEDGSLVAIYPCEVRHDVAAELEYLATRIPAAYDAHDWPLLTRLEAARHRLQFDGPRPLPRTI